MSGYVLPHDLPGERRRLALMSQLLDPMHRRFLRGLGLQAGWRCLEIGCGNGSISKWLATQVGPSGHVVACDIDTTYIADAQEPCLEVRRLDILKDPVEEAAYDLVTARAVLHHIQSPEKAAQRMIAALKPGGWLLCIEPDMLPATATEPEPVRAFWHGWLQWSAAVGIDYFIGRKMPARLSEFGMEAVSAEGCTALYCGGSPWATYWVETIQELQSRLLTSGFVTDELLTAFYDSYNNPQYWTSAITFTASWGRNR